MPSDASGPASPARAWLLAACAFAFATVLWDTFGAPRYGGAIGTDLIHVGPSAYTVTYVVPGMPAALAGLRAGDILYFPQTVYYRNNIVGQRYSLRAQRNGTFFDVSLVRVPTLVLPSDWFANLMNGWCAAFAVVVAWFGVGRRARLVSWLFLFWAIGGNGLGAIVTPWPWLNELAYLLAGIFAALPAVAIAAISSTFGHPIGPWRRVLEWSTYGVSIGVIVINILNELIQVTPWFDRFWPLVASNGKIDAAWAASNLLAAACALLALATARGEERQRARWLLIPVGAIVVVGAIWDVAGRFAGGYYSEAQQTLAIVGALATLMLFGIMTYAVLRRRLVDVAFIANRAAVFAAISLIVIGIFVAFEWLFNDFFERATHAESTIASLAVAIALGVSLRYIHRYVDKFVDRIFFRQRYERENALRDFAHEAAFIGDRDVLLDDTLREVRKNADIDDVAILLPGVDGTYATVRRADGVSSSVEPNDRAILKLRAWHKPINLHDVDTALAGTRAYPMMARGELLGVLVCGDKRDHQAFAPDEDDALFTMARGVGSALGALRESNHDGVIDAIREVRDIIRDQSELVRDLPNEISRLISASRVENVDPEGEVGNQVD